MVFFTCNHCGESLKKQAVEKHYQFQKCRGAPIFVSCMDCMKDFKENEYNGHTKCISEAEKYSGKDFVAKPSQNKGQKKQEAWIDIIQKVLEKPDLPASVRNVLKLLTKHENVPRKKVKFINFMKNVSRQTAAGDVERIFDLIEVASKIERSTKSDINQNSNGSIDEKNNKLEDETVANEISSSTCDKIVENDKKMKKKNKNKNEPINKEQVNENEDKCDDKATTEEPAVSNGVPKKDKKRKLTNGSTINDTLAAAIPNKKKKKSTINEVATESGIESIKADKPTKKSKKQKNKTIDNTTSTSNSVEVSFPWKETIRNILAEKESMKMERLKKKLIKQYSFFDKEHTTMDTIDLLLMRKLRKMKNIIIDENIVRLVVSQ